MDILNTVFKVTKNSALPEFVKLEFMKEIGFAHKQALEGCNSLMQLSGLVAALCEVSKK